MRIVPLLVLAVLAAGCSGSSENLSPGPGPELPVAPKQTLLRVPPLDKGEATRDERSARGQWLRSLHAAARSGSDWVFPSPSRSALLRRLERQARAHHFQVVSLEMLHQRQLAPVMVVRTAHPLALAHATLSVLKGLDPNYGRGEPSELYEGLYFAAVDTKGVPLFSASEVVRGGYEGGEWARSDDLSPIPHWSAQVRDRSVLTAGTRPGRSAKVHRIGPRQAVDGAKSARSFWHRYLTKEARLAPRRRFASPSRTVLLDRLQREASEHGFEVVSVKMLHPLQLAPEVVVRTTHYVALSRATGDILRALDPNGRTTWDYEGFYFEARDERNVPFFAAYNVIRGQIMGGQWARSEALYPFPHG